MRGESGRIRGLLTDAEGHRLALEARITLPSDPTEPLGTMQRGRIEGTLAPVTSAGLARPIAEVHGTFIVGPDGRGNFEAAIAGLALAAGTRPGIAGKLAGNFADPRGDEARAGRFTGRWALCR